MGIKEGITHTIEEIGKPIKGKVEQFSDALTCQCIQREFTAGILSGIRTEINELMDETHQRIWDIRKQTKFSSISSLAAWDQAMHDLAFSSSLQLDLIFRFTPYSVSGRQPNLELSLMETVEEEIGDSPYFNSLLEEKWESLPESIRDLVMEVKGKGPFCWFVKREIARLYVHTLQRMIRITTLPVPNELNQASRKKKKK